MGWIIRFSIVCTALIVGGLLVVWGFYGFRSLGVEGHVAFAMFLGIFFTIAVSVALMALIFYSNRGGFDSAAQDAAQRAEEPKQDDHVPRQ